MEQITKDRKSYLPLIVSKLKSIGIEKVILFGSLTSGEVHPDSDIDIIVVTNDDFMPECYREKSEVYSKVSMPCHQDFMVCTTSSCYHVLWQFAG